MKSWFLAVVLHGSVLGAFVLFLLWNAGKFDSAVQASPVLPVAVLPDVKLPVSGLPASLPLTTACMGGVTWAYDAVSHRWFKLRPHGKTFLPCDVGDVRALLERDGVVRRYPKAWGLGRSGTGNRVKRQKPTSATTVGPPVVAGAAVVVGVVTGKLRYGAK